MASDDRPVTGEAPPPQRVAKDHHRGTIELIVGHLEVPPQRRRHAQYMEVARAHALPLETFRLVRSGHGRLPGFELGDRVERAIPFRESAIHAERSSVARPVAARLHDNRDPVGMRVRRRLEQNGVHRTEYRGASADSQRQR